MPKPPLTQKKQRWVKNRDVTLRGTQLNYNVSQQNRYVVALKKLVEKMTKESKQKILKLFRGEIADDYFEQQEKASAMDASIANQAKILMEKLTDKFTQLFNTKAKSLAEQMLENSANVSKTVLHASLKQLSGGLSLKTGVVPEGMEDIASASVSENVSLIKSIPQQYFKDITGSVMRSITTGNGLADLIPEINKYTNQTSRRVKNLALDQTRKAYNSINKVRMQSIGVKQFEWVHSGGGQHPRASHIKMSGRIFDFENLQKQQDALGVPKADQGIPGYANNCNCTMIPVIRFDDES